jgi:hypothetical protein
MTEPLLAPSPRASTLVGHASGNEQAALVQMRALFPDHPTAALEQALREYDENVEKAVDRILIDEQLRADFEIAQALQP